MISVGQISSSSSRSPMPGSTGTSSLSISISGGSAASGSRTSMIFAPGKRARIAATEGSFLASRRATSRRACSISDSVSPPRSRETRDDPAPPGPCVEPRRQVADEHARRVFGQADLDAARIELHGPQELLDLNLQRHVAIGVAQARRDQSSRRCAARPVLLRPAAAAPATGNGLGLGAHEAHRLPAAIRSHRDGLCGDWRRPEAGARLASTAGAGRRRAVRSVASRALRRRATSAPRRASAASRHGRCGSAPSRRR